MGGNCDKGWQLGPSGPGRYGNIINQERITMKSTKILILILLVMVLFTAYLISYTIFRFNHFEVCGQDKQLYIIFPEDNPVLYYLYRPLSYIDANINDIGIHIGPQ